MTQNFDLNNMSFIDMYEQTQGKQAEEGKLPSSTMSEEEAIGMGILSPEPQEPQNENKVNYADDGTNGKEYKKLGFLASQADMAKTVGAEALKILAPKKNGFVDNITGHHLWTEDDLYKHEAQTHYAENLRNTYKWGVGLAAALAIPEIGAAKLVAAVPKATKFATAISKALGTGKWITIPAKTKGLKLQAIKAFNAATTGLVGSEVAEFFLRRPEENEGQLADIFGATDNDFIRALQSDPTDTYWEDKWKAVANGALGGIVGGVAIERMVIPTAKSLGGLFQGLKKWYNAKNNKEAMDGFRDMLNNKNKVDAIGYNAQFYKKVQDLRSKALETGEDVDELLMKEFTNDNIDEARALNKILEEGKEPYFNENNGQWELGVSQWDDAHRVSEESYINQRGTQWLITDMDNAVKDTWTNRGWIGQEKSSLVSDKGVNKTVAQKVVKNYVDKWNLPNNVKVEVIEGLTDSTGKAVEGRTVPASNKGKAIKPTKSQQNKIDKKQLEIQQLQDKITMLEGGNAEVTDPLDVLKEKLRIANNELKELQNPPKVNIAKDITIKIDKNTQNPYAVLRSELEHVRDFATGSKKLTKGEKHSFPRYNDVETEDALAAKYVRKKAQGKADALSGTKKAVVDETQSVKPSNSVSKQVQVDETITKIESKTNTEDAIQGLKSGEITFSNETHVESFIEKLTPEIKGYKWEDIANGADDFCRLLNNLIKDNKGLNRVVQALAIDGDVETLNKFTVKGLALTKTLGTLLDKVNVEALKLGDKELDALLTSIDNINKYLDNMGSAKGGSLRAQAFINEGRKSFATKGISAMTQEGITSFSGLLAKILEENSGANFTLSETIQKVSEALINTGDENAVEVVEAIARNKRWLKKYSEIIEQSTKQKMSTAEVAEQVKYMITRARVEEVVKFANLAPTNEGKFKAICKVGTSYYITNLLSGVATQVRNTASGLINTAIFPAYKIMASKLGAGENAGMLAAEGWNTYKSLITSAREAMGMARQAFINGEGKFSSIKTLAEETGEKDFTLDMTNLLDKDNSFIQNFWNAYSIMSRAMMASDEFIQQMNYRAIARGKVTAEAEKLVQQGVLNEANIDDFIENTLNSNYYYENKMAKDMDILYEARQMTYQNNLDGTITNPKTGEKVQMRTQSMLMNLAEKANQVANSNSVLKMAFPFLRTATNIVQNQLDSNILYTTGRFTVERIDEVGFTQFFTKETLKKLMEQSPEAAMARARCAMGTMSLVSGMTLAAGGLITGSMPIDETERKALLATGWRPYSILCNGKYISYAGIEPVQGWLSFAADTFNLLTRVSQEDTDAKTKLQTVLGMGYAQLIDNFADKAAFKTGTTQLNSLLDKNPEQYLQGIAQGMLPAKGLITSLSNIGERSNTKPDGFKQIVLNKYGNKGLGDYRRDVFGNRQDLVGTLILGDAATNLYQTNPEYVEIYNLMKDGYNPSTVPNIITGKVKYKDFINPDTGRSAYDAVLEEMSNLQIDGMTLNVAIREAIQSDEYKSLSEQEFDEKTEMLNTIFREYVYEAKENIAEKGELFVHKKSKVTLRDAEDEEIINQIQKDSQRQLNDNITNQIKAFGQ